MKQNILEKKEKFKRTSFSLYPDDINKLNEIRKMKNFKYSKSFILRGLIRYYYKNLTQKSL